jgi:histidyl-tRNA synthetase
VRRREYVIGIVKRVYERYGFEPLETPAVENLETLMGKYGEEGNQLIFKILKRGDALKDVALADAADLALRYDLTVPLARVIAHHQAKLPRLFKRYQIQPVWRADRPARGRFREFYQCDVDALGTTSPVVEAEVYAAVSDVMTDLGFRDFVIRLNHRQLLGGLLTGFGVPEELHGQALVAIDKLDKIGPDGVDRELAHRAISEASRDVILRFFHDMGEFSKSIVGGDWTQANAALLEYGMVHAHAGVAPLAFQNLREIFALTASTPAAARMRLDFTLARGLSYYTGAIMELNVPDLAGSLGGGGRYDNLVGMFLGQGVPACGFSLGLERILVVMGERGMFPASLATTPADVMIAVFDAKDTPHAMRVAQMLRASGVRVMVYPDADKIGKQIKYADAQRIPYVAILGGDEIANGTVTVKNLTAQTQTTYDQAAAGAAILEGLRHRG